MKIYLKVTDFDREEINPYLDINLSAETDNIIDVFFLDEWEDGLNIEGAVVQFVVKEKSTDLDSDALINLHFDDSTFPNCLSGEAAITLLKENVTGLLGNYLYQILIKFNDDVPLKVAAEGNICFKGNLWGGSTGATGSAPYTSDIYNY